MAFLSALKAALTGACISLAASRLAFIFSALACITASMVGQMQPADRGTSGSMRIRLHRARLLAVAQQAQPAGCGAWRTRAMVGASSY
jgi:hypothetical protein